ncbi:hypothetical protein SLEP1_g38042 [Rubroshorea leprosula]|uniref:Uncharacterized protein n=1 Tax=Rubroshorea leprosula TaxID=152421 RepID=A0AAV5KWW8_9ROSI|nr:hypothetical protein SLEP1_g38042 [Rubroshorea leprosula]
MNFLKKQIWIYHRSCVFVSEIVPMDENAADEIHEGG